MMAARRMRIQLNGESFELPDGETVAALLTRLDLTGRRVAVELNLDIVPQIRIFSSVEWPQREWSK